MAIVIKLFMTKVHNKGAHPFNQCQIVKLVVNWNNRSFAEYSVLRTTHNQTKIRLTTIEYIAKSLF